MYLLGGSGGGHIFVRGPRTAKSFCNIFFFFWTSLGWLCHMCVFDWRVLYCLLVSLVLFLSHFTYQIVWMTTRPNLCYCYAYILIDMHLLLLGFIQIFSACRNYDGGTNGTKICYALSLLTSLKLLSTDRPRLSNQSNSFITPTCLHARWKWEQDAQQQRKEKTTFFVLRRCL